MQGKKGKKGRTSLMGKRTRDKSYAVILAAAVAVTSFGGSSVYAGNLPRTGTMAEEGVAGTEEREELPAESVDFGAEDAVEETIVAEEGIEAPSADSIVEEADGIEGTGLEVGESVPEINGVQEQSLEALPVDGAVSRNGSFAFNTRVEGSLENEKKRDLYVITAEDKELFYSFVCTNASDVNMYITISDNEQFAGNAIAKEEVVKKKSISWDLAKKLQRGKVYYLEVKYTGQTLSAPAPYFFQMNTVEDDVKDTVLEAEAVPLNQKITRGLQNAGDVDYFSFTTSSNPETFYDLEFTHGGTEGSMYVTVYEDEFFVKDFPECNADKGKSFDQNLSKLLPNHTYYIKVKYTKYSGLSKTAPYYFKVNSVEDDVMDDTGRATVFQVGKKVTKALQNRNDVDIFKFTTPDTDSFYWFELTNLSDDAKIKYQIYDNEELAGNRIIDATQDEKKYGKHAMGKLKRKHTYYLKVFHYDYWYSYYGRSSAYTFSVTSLLDDMNNKVNNGDDKLENITTLNIGKSLKRGIQDSSDVDYYKFTTKKDENFYELSFDNTGDCTISIQIWDNKEFAGAGSLDESISGKRSNTFNLQKLKSNHTYYMKVFRYPYDSFKKEVKYIMKLNSTKDDVKDTALSAKKLSLNETKTYGLQNEKDVDWFKFTTTDYTSYQLKFSNISKDSYMEINIYKNKNEVWDQRVMYAYVGGKRSVSAQQATLKLSRYHTYYIKISGSAKGKYKLGINAQGPSSSKLQKVSKKKVKLTWSKVPRAAGYEIYRAEGKNGKYKKIKTIKNSKTVKYTDSKKLKKGKTYFYKIRAYKKAKGKTYYSAYSAAKSVKIK